MSERLSWADAERSAAAIRRRPRDRQTLHALALFPLAHAWLLECLFGFDGDTAIYRSLARLREGGLVAAIRPPLVAGCSPQRLSLTDLGLATVALEWKVDPSSLANRLHLRGTHLLNLLPCLPQLSALYDLLAALAASGPVQPSFLAWQRPWRNRFQPHNAKTPVSLTLPAYAAFSWKEAAHGFFLLPDLGDLPLAVHRLTLSRLLAYRKALRRDDDVPTLLIAAPGAGRVRAWQTFLEEIRAARWDYPLDASVMAWADLPTLDLQRLVRNRPRSPEDLCCSHRLIPLRPRRPSMPLPRLVGAAPVAGREAGTGTDFRQSALVLSPADRSLLLLVGRHAYLPPASMAIVLNWTVKAVRRQLAHLISLGLLRLVGTDEIGKHASLELAEITVEGMKLLAAGQGLSLARAIVYHGLTGGGLEEPIGARQALLTNLAHTLGTDALFVRLHATAHELAQFGTDDGVLEWKNGTACSRRYLRPDGSGRYHRCGRVYDFYLEYDRATMSIPGYLHKFRAYYRYWQGQRRDRNRYDFPTTLCVSVSEAAEERIARAARHAAHGQYAPLPLLLTTQARVDASPNHLGLLGCIWREPDDDLDDRNYWLPVADLDRLALQLELALEGGDRG